MLLVINTLRPLSAAARVLGWAREKTPVSLTTEPAAILPFQLRNLFLRPRSNGTYLSKKSMLASVIIHSTASVQLHANPWKSLQLDCLLQVFWPLLRVRVLSNLSASARATFFFFFLFFAAVTGQQLECSVFVSLLFSSLRLTRQTLLDVTSRYAADRGKLDRAGWHFRSLDFCFG